MLVGLGWSIDSSFFISNAGISAACISHCIYRFMLAYFSIFTYPFSKGSKWNVVAQKFGLDISTFI